MGYNAGFDRLAEKYDKFHKAHESFAEIVERWCPRSNDLRFLDVGCGTGTETRQVMQTLGCVAVGVDVALGMLRKAKRKGEGAFWIRGEAERLPFLSGAFRCVGCFFSAHHFSDLERAASELWRVLCGSGVALVFTISHEQMGRSAEHLYLPEVADWDVRHVPEVVALCDIMRRQGFWVGVEEIHYETRRVDDNFVKRIRNRYRFALQQMSAECIDAGVKRIEADLRMGRGRRDEMMCTVLVCAKGDGD